MREFQLCEDELLRFEREGWIGPFPLLAADEARALAPELRRAFDRTRGYHYPDREELARFYAEHHSYYEEEPWFQSLHALSPRLRGIKDKRELDIIVERCLTRAALWDEVKDRLDALGSLLSGGQQQRLTIARALSQEPELLVLDEFSIAVDPVTTMRIEDVLKELRKEVTILLVTNLVQQARRLASRTAFFLGGECVEVGETEELFTGTVKDQRTRDYVEGRFG